jgi:hypothetical protein
MVRAAVWYSAAFMMQQLLQMSIVCIPSLWSFQWDFYEIKKNAYLNNGDNSGYVR